MVEKPAIEGGKPVREKPLPSVDDISGRYMGEEELRLLREVIESGRLFRYSGTKVKELEERFAEYFGVRYAVATTSGTAALHAALASTMINPGSEVITTPITDMGTVIPIIAQNSIPVFADVDPETINIDPDDVERKITDKTYAIIVVHVFGQPCEMNRIMEIAEKHDLYVIEDCAEAFLAEYKGKKVGTIGDLGAFSFQQSKHMTTGDGGILITDDEKLARNARFFTDKGWDRSISGPRSYVSFGLNYRMNELTAAVALAQLNRLKDVVEKRRRVASWLTKQLEGIDGITLPKVIDGVKHSYWFYPIFIDYKRLGISNEQFAKALNAEGVSAGTWIGKPLYLGPIFLEKRMYGNSKCPFDCHYYNREIKYEPGICPNAEEVSRKLVVLGCNEKYTYEDTVDIATAVEKVAKYYLLKNR
jgi:dTDP-4-amino-4,6-dideoxygalactose transaminase